MGLHSDENAPAIETPEDLPEHGEGSTPGAPQAAPRPAITKPSDNKPPPEQHEEEEEQEATGDDLKSVWSWIMQSLEGFKDKVHGIFSGIAGKLNPSNAS